MHSNIRVLLLGLGVLALSQFPVSIAYANTTCEIVKERRCDFKGNCKEEVKEVCTGLSGPRKGANPQNAPLRAPAKALAK